MPDVKPYKLSPKKRCIACERELDRSCFYSYGYTTRQGKASTRIESRCEECARARRIARYAVKGDMDRATSNAWKDRNRDHLRQYSKTRQQDQAHRANKAKAQRMRKARLRAATLNHDPAIAAIYQEAMDWEKKLAACVASDDPLDLCVHVDHEIPLKGKNVCGLHVAANLRVVSAYLNLRKGATHA